MDYNGLVTQLREHRDEQEVGSNKYMGNSAFYIKYPKINVIIVIVEESNVFKLVKKRNILYEQKYAKRNKRRNYERNQYWHR